MIHSEHLEIISRQTHRHRVPPLLCRHLRIGSETTTPWFSPPILISRGAMVRSCAIEYYAQLLTKGHIDIAGAVT